MAAGVTAGWQTYGYLASYAAFANPYVNGAIHYPSFKAACLAYFTTITSLKYAQELTEKENDKDEKKEEKDEEKSLIYDEERYPFNPF